MNIKKSLLVTGAVAAVGLTGATGIGVASAATDSPSAGLGTSSLIDRVAEKFNLNKEEVKTVFEEEHAERKAEMQQRQEERLDQAVADGKLTEEQKQKILAKLAEVRVQHEAAFESMKDKTPEERKALKQELHGELEDLRAWAEENDIPEEYLRLVGGPKPVMHLKSDAPVNE
jgi:HD superfamily phosphohydrolase